ncbi:citramalate synthase [Clostridia bacterium]|nr:citramalate synthase [Clostridia bacterium]
MKTIEIFDSTLRDGAQGGGISFSFSDKVKIAAKLDAFGVSFIEAGNPSSNPKDRELFSHFKGEHALKTAKLVAFGATARKNTAAADDEGLRALLSCSAEYVTIFGKSWDFHATEIIGVSLSENLSLIRDSITYLTENGRKVFFDAEHFFDGYKANPDYALDSIKTAVQAGAKTIILCDTNGGSFPFEIAAGVRAAKAAVPSVNIGIHCHNDNGCAVAGSIDAVRAGAVQVQGTFTGIGERAGNANLSAIVPNLQLKLGYHAVPPENLPLITETAIYISEIANTAVPPSMPYVGTLAFSHKAGMHVDGVLKDPRAFEHIPPETVGGTRHFLLSEVSGRSAVIDKIKPLFPDFGNDKSNPAVIALSEKIKAMERHGYQFEAADASFELMAAKEFGKFTPFFEILDFKIVSGGCLNLDCESEKAVTESALIKIKVGERFEITADEGNGPVNAIDKALRKSLEVFYPVLSRMYLTDYKVRVISGEGTSSTTRVLIESSDGENTWQTVGASEDIIVASVAALTDSIEYLLYTRREYNYNSLTK